MVRASADDEEGEKKEKKPKKKIPSPVKRVMLAEDRRKYNKSRKSACATRIKKVRRWQWHSGMRGKPGSVPLWLGLGEECVEAL